MARVKKGVNAHKRHKKVLKQAKGFYGQRSRNFRAANPAVMRALRSAFVGRKNKKREYRRLWIARINAAARANGINYSNLMNGLKKSGIELNRKMLSEMAIYDAAGFAELCEIAKKANKHMEYFLSHIGVIFVAAIIVAVFAVIWWGLTARNEYLKRKRAMARKEAALAKHNEQNKND